MNVTTPIFPDRSARLPEQLNRNRTPSSSGPAARDLPALEDQRQQLAQQQAEWERRSEELQERQDTQRAEYDLELEKHER